MLIQWTTKLEVGHPTIDRDHKQLVAIINELHDSMRQGGSGDVLGRILDRLAAYTREHFVREERLMEQAGYSDLPDHRRKHQELIDRLNTLMAEHRSGSRAVGVETMNFLSEWLTKHIKQDDAKLAAVLAT